MVSPLNAVLSDHPALASCKLSALLVRIAVATALGEPFPA